MNAIDRKDAERLFEEADQLYREHQYAESLAILNRLNEAFPNKHRILFPRARCLAKLGQFHEALEVCQTLVREHEYDKARPLLDKLIEHETAPSTVELEPYIRSSGFETPPPTDGRAFDSKIDLRSPPPMGVSHYKKKEPRVKIKPVRLLLLAFIGVAIWRGWIVWWLGAGLVAAYFILRIVIGRLLLRLLETPFRMKGAALRGASAVVHGVRPCAAPPRRDADEDDDAEPTGPLEWYEIDVTITPVPNDGPFKFWEPGELALVPAGVRIKKADDIDNMLSVADCRFVNPPPRGEGEGDEEDDADGGGPYKVHGAHRVMLTAGVPPDLREAHFAYYFEVFGDLRLR